MRDVKLFSMGDPVQELVEHTTSQLRKVAEAVRDTPEGKQFLRLAKSLEVLAEQPAPSLSAMLDELDTGRLLDALLPKDEGEIVIETKVVPDNRPPKKLSVRSKLREAIRSGAKGWSYDDVMDYWEGRGDPIESKPPVRNAANALRNKDELVNDPETNLMWHPEFFAPVALAAEMRKAGQVDLVAPLEDAQDVMAEPTFIGGSLTRGVVLDAR